jgi:hypothetical protein
MKLNPIPVSQVPILVKSTVEAQEGIKKELVLLQNTTRSGDEELKNHPKREEPPAEREGKYYFRLHLNDP